MSEHRPSNSLDGFHRDEVANHMDSQVRRFFGALNAGDEEHLDDIVARNFLSYDYRGTRTRTGFKRYQRRLRAAFAELRYEMHENVGVLVDGDLVAARTLLTGIHTGPYVGYAASGAAVSTSASHIFRLRHGLIAEHWPVVDTYRILVQIGAIEGAAGKWQEMLGAPSSGTGLFDERPGTPFGEHGGQGSPEVSRELQVRLWDGVFATGTKLDSDYIAQDLLSNSGWIPDGREPFVDALSSARARKPDGRATPTHIVAEGNLFYVRSVWDGTMLATGNDHDASSVDIFRVENARLQEHWETVDQLRLYQDYGVLDGDVRDE
ncbi:ester cyclase [Saccharopolyspora pogona]|uniref:ester cyclase n=1 Tax=Saccharopolyspora pogona TaxID=333966 RepID=UPI00168A143B|nr:ester cyclase [Saccharopolyspora pogona]